MNQEPIRFLNCVNSESLKFCNHCSKSISLLSSDESNASDSGRGICKRGNSRHGRAAASISVIKQRRIVFAARHYLLRLATLPPCRFDVVLQEPQGLQWLQAAFEAR